VFAALADASASAGELAEELSLDPLGTEALLTALAALGYLEVDAAGSYRPSEAGLRLIAGEAGSLAHFIGAYNAHAWAMLGDLDEVLSGRKTAASHQLPVGDPFWDPYVRGLFELTSEEHDEAACLVRVRRPQRLLDVAGGHGGFAMAMCRRHAGLHATVLDLPASAAVGRAIVAEQGLSERVSFRTGDALAVELGKQLDVVSIFNLLHHLAPPDVRALLARAHASLRAGGWLVIGETERSEPGEPANLAGAMSGLIYFASSGTRNYTRSELAGWLASAGLDDLRVHQSEVSPWRLLYLARASGSLPAGFSYAR
jgi:2-polyprenyl-3-methyl-5-hydroxy-6-metoxy-1,4-benzoquinol methylase